MNEIRLVLVDDHHVVRKGLYSLLNPYPEMSVVGEASSGEELLTHIEDWLPDVVVMDLLLPGGIGGIETTRRIREMVPNTRVVVLTAYGDDARVIAALRAGAIGYIKKDADPETLLMAIREAACGRSVLDPAIARLVLEDLMAGSDVGDVLTNREREVLKLMAHGLTNPRIAEKLFISQETVKTHVGNILSKLQIAHRLQAVISALKRGIIALDDIDLPPNQ